MYQKILQKYLLRKSFKAVGAALKRLELFKDDEHTYLNIGNSGVMVDLKLMEGKIKQILIDFCEKEAKK